MLLAGLRRHHSFADSPSSIPEQWDDFARLGRIPGQVGDVAYGAICGADPAKQSLEYLVGVEVQRFDDLPADLGRMRVPAVRYAVFTHEGPVAAIRATWDEAMNDWLPTSGFASAQTPDFERYDERFDASTGSGVVEIWLGIVPANRAVARSAGAAPAEPGTTLKQRLQTFGRHPQVRYALSLPERVLRSVSALSAGTVREVADLTLPAGVRRSRVYRNLVDTTLRFLIERVGEVEGTYSTETQLAEDFFMRRTVGNGIELMGLVAFRASPVWVLAALADICGVGRQMIPEIAETLRREGLLEPGESFATIEQLLEGLESTSAQLAETANTPPLDVAGLRAEWEKFSREAQKLPRPSLPTPAAVMSLWSDLSAAAAEQDRTVFEMSSLLAVSAASRLPKGARLLSRSATLALSKGGNAFSQTLLEHYRATLTEVRRVGYLEYGTRQLKPYVHAALRSFSPEQETLTAKLWREPDDKNSSPG